MGDGDLGRCVPIMSALVGEVELGLSACPVRVPASAQY